MMRDLDAISDEEILTALARARLGPPGEPLHLNPYPSNFDRNDTRRRAAFRVWAGDRVAFHLTIGPALGRLHDRTESFARENPEIVCKPLFFFRDQEIDFFGQECFGAANLEDGIASRRIDERTWQEAVVFIQAKLAATVRPSTLRDLLAEIDSIERGFMAVEWFGPLDQAFAQAAIFPLIRHGATSLPLRTSWTNGDFVAKNILFDGPGGYRLIDCEFAGRTHFGALDWFRLQHFSSVPGGVDLAGLSGVGEWPKWLEMLGWLQHALRLDEVSHPHLVGGDLEIIAEKIARLSESAAALAKRSIFVSAMERAVSSGAGTAAALPIAQVFWPAEDGYAEERSARQPVPVLDAWTELSFDLPALAASSVVRIDPSDQPGYLEISKIAIEVPGNGSTTGFVAELIATAEGAAKLTAMGDCMALPQSTPLRFVMFGADPILTLPPLPAAVAGRAARLTVNLRISPQVPQSLWREARCIAETAARASARAAELAEQTARLTARLSESQARIVDQANQFRTHMEQVLAELGAAISRANRADRDFAPIPRQDNDRPRRWAWWPSPSAEKGEFAGAGSWREIRFAVDSPSSAESQLSGHPLRVHGWFFDARLRAAKQIEVRLGDKTVLCQPSARKDVADRFRHLGRLPLEIGFSAEIETEHAFEHLEINAVGQTGKRFILAQRLLQLEGAAWPAGKPVLPPVSLIIPTQNGGEMFRLCLQAIRAQDYPAEVQLLVVDSGSNDGTDLLAESFGAQVVRIQKSDFHHSRTRQMALQHARHDFVVYFVQDAVPENATWMQHMVGALLRNPSAVACYGRQEPHSDADLYARFESLLHNRYLGDKPRLQSPPPPGIIEDYAAALYRCRFDNVCAIYRRAALNDCPFPDVPFGEDMAWAKSALDRGWSVAFEPAVRVRHSHNRPPEYRRRRSFVDTVCCARIIGLPPSPRPLLSTPAQLEGLIALIDRAAALDALIEQRGGLRGVTNEAIREYLGRPTEDPILAAWSQGAYEQIAFILTQIGAMFPREDLAAYRQSLEQAIASAQGTTLGNIYVNHVAQRSMPGWLEQAAAPLFEGV